MRDAPEFRISEVCVFERGVKFRLPFRFGAVTVTACPQAFVRVRVVFGSGRSAIGASAELLIPKWFDKATTKSEARNIAGRGWYWAARSHAEEQFHRQGGSACIALQGAGPRFAFACDRHRAGRPEAVFAAGGIADERRSQSR